MEAYLRPLVYIYIYIIYIYIFILTQFCYITNLECVNFQDPSSWNRNPSNFRFGFFV